MASTLSGTPPSMDAARDEPTINRWFIPGGAIAIHMSILSVYADRPIHLLAAPLMLGILLAQLTTPLNPKKA